MMPNSTVAEVKAVEWNGSGSDDGGTKNAQPGEGKSPMSTTAKRRPRRDQHAKRRRDVHAKTTTAKREDDAETSTRRPRLRREDDAETSTRRPRLRREDDAETSTRRPRLRRQDDAETSTRRPRLRRGEDDAETSTRRPRLRRQDDAERSTPTPCLRRRRCPKRGKFQIWEPRSSQTTHAREWPPPMIRKRKREVPTKLSCELLRLLGKRIGP